MASPQIHEPAEVVIVGSGMAGSTLAAELAHAGFDVLTLEAGPERRVEDMVSSEIWSRRLRWAGAPIEGDGDLTGAITFGMGWGTGGAGLHWYGNWYRYQETDFKERSLWGRGLDWPIEYQDLRTAYDRAQKQFDVSGDLVREPWGPPADNYPMPALPELPQTRALRKGFEAHGFQTAPNSQAINSRAFDGRAPCIFDGWCDAGCPIGALANPRSCCSGPRPSLRAPGCVTTPRSHGSSRMPQVVASRVSNIEVRAVGCTYSPLVS